VEGDGMYVVIELLHNDHSEGIARGICFKDKLFGPVEGMKDQITCAGIFELLKGILFN
jgi:hypothetical protein